MNNFNEMLTEKLKRAYEFLQCGFSAETSDTAMKFYGIDKVVNAESEKTVQQYEKLESLIKDNAGTNIAELINEVFTLECTAYDEGFIKGFLTAIALNNSF